MFVKKKTNEKEKKSVGGIFLRKCGICVKKLYEIFLCKNIILCRHYPFYSIILTFACLCVCVCVCVCARVFVHVCVSLHSFTVKVSSD